MKHSFAVLLCLFLAGLVLPTDAVQQPSTSHTLIDQDGERLFLDDVSGVPTLMAVHGANGEPLWLSESELSHRAGEATTDPLVEALRAQLAELQPSAECLEWSTSFGGAAAAQAFVSPRNLDGRLHDSGYVALARVAAIEPGFQGTIPGSVVTVAVEDVLKGDGEGRSFHHFFVPVGKVRFGDHLLCGVDRHYGSGFGPGELLVLMVGVSEDFYAALLPDQIRRAGDLAPSEGLGESRLRRLENAPKKSCVPSHTGRTANYSAVKMQWAAGLNGMAAGFNAAMDQWGGCNPTGGTRLIPDFTTGPGEASITIERRSGRNPLAGKGCAGYGGAMNGSSGTIALYDESNAGEDCSDEYADQEAITTLVAHELGHYLGYPDLASGCKVLMGDPWHFPGGQRTGHDVSTVECFYTDSWNKTTEEEAEEEWEECGQNGCGQDSDSPVVLDLDGNWFRFSSVEDGVLFDIDRDGEVEQVAWPLDGNDAFLCRDFNHNGAIDSVGEMFGNHSFSVLTKEPVDHGYEALAEYDLFFMGGSGDGFLSADDAAFRWLCVWSDWNRNGQTDAGELRSLQEVGVQRIDLNFREIGAKDATGNLLRFRAPYYPEQGATPRHRFWSVDVFLRNEPAE